MNVRFSFLANWRSGHYPKLRLFLGCPGARVGDIPSRYAKDAAPRTHGGPASIDLAGYFLVASGAYLSVLRKGRVSVKASASEGRSPEAMPLAAGFGDGGGVPNAVKAAEAFPVEPVAWRGCRPIVARPVNDRDGNYAAGSTLTAARCS
jgi:hypothetical protein